ncbi:MAG: hypothetical protein R2726_05215 [Acidimicrobiales bacterium]
MRPRILALVVGALVVAGMTAGQPASWVGASVAQGTSGVGQPQDQPQLQVILPEGVFGSAGWPDGETVAVEVDDPATPASPDFSGTSSVVGQPCPPGPCGPGQFGLTTSPYDEGRRCGLGCG